MPLPALAVPDTALPGILIPDGCNAGVIFRTLVLVNGAVFGLTLLHASGLASGMTQFMENSMLVESSCLLALMALCGVRRPARHLARWIQRGLCAVLPAAVTWLVMRFLLRGGLFETGSPFPTPFEAACCGAVAGLMLQQYFELRMLAYSPALAQARLQALQARIRPHFLFNSLNAVLSLIRTEPLRAEETLTDLADLFRVLMRDARDVISLEKELELCRQYLSIEQVRLGPRLQVEWNLSALSEGMQRVAKVPALLLQPLLENAVRYGVEPASAPALIKISASRSLDRIEIVVTNPVHDAQPAADSGNHMALKNIRERLALLYDVEAQLTTSSAKGMFEVRLRFPYVKVA